MEMGGWGGWGGGGEGDGQGLAGAGRGHLGARCAGWVPQHTRLAAAPRRSLSSAPSRSAPRPFTSSQRVTFVSPLRHPNPPPADEKHGNGADTYLHRVGRAGRFGTKGLGITFVASPADSEVLNQVQVRRAGGCGSGSSRGGCGSGFSGFSGCGVCSCWEREAGSLPAHAHTLSWPTTATPQPFPSLPSATPVRAGALRRRHQAAAGAHRRVHLHERRVMDGRLGDRGEGCAAATAARRLRPCGGCRRLLHVCHARLSPLSFCCCSCLDAHSRAFPFCLTPSVHPMLAI